MPKSLVRETTPTAVGEAAEKGTVPITVASPGWGSSGFYSAKVLENAVEAKVFGKGLHMYLDHPSETERHDRPERSVRDLVAVLDEDSTWDPQHGIVGEAKVFGPYRDLFKDKDFVDAIGVSLRAFADSTVGEAEGRKGVIITDLFEAQSVDFVTKAGRGGKVMAAMESARAGASEANSDDVRTALDTAVGEHVRDGFVRDFDPDTSTVYVRTFDPAGDVSRVHAHPYTYDAPNAVIDWDDATEVRPVTTYVPTASAAVGEGPTNDPAPAGQSTANESQETHMATTPIEEATLAALRQDAERVPTLESERDTAITERDQLREAAADRARTDAARIVIDAQEREAGITFTDLETRGLMHDLPVNESGDLDEDAYTASVTEAATDKAATNGAGRINGFGASVNQSGTDHIAAAESAAAGAFGRTTKEA